MRVRDCIVLVEDYEQTLRDLVRIATRRRFRVVTATTIGEAEAVLCQVDPASVAGGLFDMMLAGKSSLPCVQRARRAWPRALIAALTGYRALYSEDLEHLGVEIIEKPCGPRPLQDFFRRVAAASADGELSIADAVDLVSRQRGLSVPLTRIIAACASGTPRAQLPAATGIPEKTIQGYLRGSRADALLALVLRVAHDGPAELFAETEGAALT